VLLGWSQFRCLSTLCFVASGACTVGPPSLMAPPDNPLPDVPTYADAVLDISTGDETIACTEEGGVPLCGQAPQAGPCADNAALGPPDGLSHDLGPLDRIELGLLCSSIREVGGNTVSDDFRIWGRVEGGAQPVVEVSTDGTNYFAVNFWPSSMGTYRENPGFQLEVPQIPQARFVRITEVAGQGQIRIDAIEAFPLGGAP